MSRLEELIRDYRGSCTVPKHPKKCPQCGSKVGVFHLNFDEAIWMCSNAKCVWPLATHSPSQIFGRSNVMKLMEIKLEKRKLKADESTSDELSSRSDCEVSPAKKPRIEATNQAVAMGNIAKIIATSNSPQGASSVSKNVQPQKVLEKVILPPEDEQNELEDHNVVQAANEGDSHLEAEPTANEEKSTEIIENEDKNEAPTTPFHFPSFDVPTMLSPLGASPAHSTISMFKSPGRTMATPLRDDDEDGFARPSSVMSSSRVPSFHLPPLMSPLPMTPFANRGSERSVGNLEDDLDITDSEASDVERTPRRPDSRPKLDMPFVGSPAAPRHNYSKDLSSLQLKEGPIKMLFKRTESIEEPTNNSSSHVKVLLKRQSGNEWNVEENNAAYEDVVLPDRPALSGKQPVKLDKVVLNLKKSVSGNIWNVTEKKPEENVSSESTTQNPPATNLPPKEERRGRKSKAAPMKIQNVEEIAHLPPPPIPSQPKVPPQEDVIILPSQPSAAPKEPEIVEIPSLEKPVQAVERITSQEEPVQAAAERITSAGVKITKTFTRKKRPCLPFSNSLPPSLPLRNPLIDSHDQNLNNNRNLESDWKEIAELSSKAALAFRREEGFSEFSQLVKAATGKNTIPDLNFIQKIQKKLNLNNVPRNGQVTFFVGQSKTSIDLPTDDTSMAVSETNATVKVMLSSQSDGIIGDVLRVKDPEPQLTIEHKKRGRPVRLRLPSPPPTLVPQPASSVLMPGAQRYHQYQDDPLYSPAAIQRFKHHLSVMMQGFVMPAEYEAYNFDPFLSMMFVRMLDPAYASINFDAMMQYYATIKSYEMHGHLIHNQQHVEQQQQQQETSAIDLPEHNQAPGSSQENQNDLTYAELQTVRGRVTDATQVLRQHQQAASESNQVKTPAAASKRPVIKIEAMTPMQPPPLDGGSVSVTSVRPAPPSVSVVPQHMANHMQGKTGKIGNGDKAVSFTYSKCNFGPIYASSDDEVKAIVALVQAKVEEREYRDLHGGRKSNGVYESTAAIRARSSLSKEVVEYLEKAFTKKGMKENIVGRKRRNYPKRSAIIKQDPVTGQLFYPNGQPVVREPIVKTEVATNNNPDPPLNYADDHGGTTPMYNPPTPVVVNATIDDIISNTQQNEVHVEEQLPLSSPERPENMKISQSLFGKKKSASSQPSSYEGLNSLAARGKGVTYSKQNEVQEQTPLPSKEELAKEEKRRKDLRRKSAVKKPKNVAIIKENHSLVIDKILSNTISNSLIPSSSQPAPNEANAISSSEYHIAMHTRKSSMNSEAQKNVAASSKRMFDPQSLLSQPELFVRRNLEDKVKKLLEKKRKKEEKQKEKKLKKLLKKSSSQYKGIGVEVTPKGLPSSSRKFTTAQNIGGRKMVLKNTGEVVEVPCAPPKKAASHNQPELVPDLEAAGKMTSQVSQAERDLIDELIRIGESAMGENFETLPAFQSQNLATHEDSSNVNKMPEFDFMQDGGEMHKDFPSLDDIF